MSKRGLGVVVSLLLAFSYHAAMADDFTLTAIHQDIVERYVGVAHIDSDALLELQEEHLMLFDVREQEEYAVSHLRHAKRLGPQDDLPATLDNVRGKTVVFYCSVGHRSSAKARALKTKLESLGATAVYNLKGGIFQWRNEEKPLMRGERPTTFVHPYNKRWGRLLDDASAIRYRAADEP